MSFILALFVLVLAVWLLVRVVRFSYAAGAASVSSPPGGVTGAVARWEFPELGLLGLERA